MHPGTDDRSSPALGRLLSRRAAFSLLAGTALLGFAACSEKEQFFSIDITGADYATGFALPDHNGKERSLADFKGKVVVLFFGFTQCPDVCPTAMTELAEVKKKLGKDGDRLQGLFITLDPERDTPELLKAYMANFDPSFLALRASLERTAEVAKHYKVFFKKSAGKTPGSYSIDHSTGSYVYDTQGRIRLYTRHGSGADGLVRDVKILLK
jgi:protein SCO1